MQIYDSLSRSKKPLQPVEGKRVRMYVCGMTVYDYCHLGHARMLVSFDIVQRWLRTRGYDVTYVRNITDIDDKIIRKAVSLGKPIHQVTDFYTDAMHADEEALGVQRPDFEPRATQHIKDMEEIIRILEQKGLAYQGDDGDVNFSVRDFQNYGKLSGRSLDDMRAGERVQVNRSKRDPLDFVLWKKAKPEEPDDSKWPCAYGLGRPGWHLECSAMSKALLGMPLDIHGGGPDLKFPHHENEIAQSEGAFGGELANTWMHCGPLMVDNEKMSKSLGNFMTIRLAVGSAASDDSAQYQVNLREAQMLRFFIVRNHYRSPQNFTPDNLIDAQVAIDRLYQTLKNAGYEEQEPDFDGDFGRAFASALDDDFNTPVAVSVLFDMANQVNRDQNSALASQLRALAGVLGLLQLSPQEYFRYSSRYTSAALAEGGSQSESLDDEQIETLIQERIDAKKNRDFARADAIREQLKAAGVILEDKPGGLTEWRRQ